MENSKLIRSAILNSLGVFIYTALVAVFMNNGEKLFGRGDNLWTMIIILLIFVLSAAVVGSLILAKPVFLYIDGQKKESVKLLLYTILSLFVITVLTAVIYILVK